MSDETKKMRLHPTDLQHIEEAIAALRARKRYTSAERMEVVRKAIEAILANPRIDWDLRYRERRTLPKDKSE